MSENSRCGLNCMIASVVGCRCDWPLSLERNGVENVTRRLAASKSTPPADRLNLPETVAGVYRSCLCCFTEVRKLLEVLKWTWCGRHLCSWNESGLATRDSVTLV